MAIDPEEVTAPESVGPLHRSVVAAAASAVTLPCDVQAHPPPTFQWYKDHTPLAQSTLARDRSLVVGGTLVIMSVGEGDEGDYRCVVNNTAGVTTLTTRLSVTTPLDVQVSPPLTQVTAGGVLELRCSVSGSPVTDVLWYKDASLVRASGKYSISEDHSLVYKMYGSSSSKRQARLLRVDAVQVADEGVYQCRAVGPTDSAHGHAIVALGASAPVLVYRFIAHTLQPGPAVSLKCIARATPTPHITWTLDGFPLPQSHRYCTVTHPRHTSPGLWMASLCHSHTGTVLPHAHPTHHLDYATVTQVLYCHTPSSHITWTMPQSYRYYTATHPRHTSPGLWMVSLYQFTGGPRLYS
ncbi:Immunoglobulin I-set [Trinorchestia longiramus]|nr:Immunoglobulin I-set [Trinorchestia longiramus]